MKKQAKAFVAAITLFIMLPFMMTPASANSAQQKWRGSDATGAIIVDGDSPIVVEHENLTFDLSEFPIEYYPDEESFLAYAGKVSAEYTFYNPSDMTVTATLAFPFGTLPDYGYSYNETAITGRAVQINGQVIDANIRHTLMSGGQFNLAGDLPRLCDDYLRDDFFSPETTVTLYTWRINKNDPDGYPRAANIATDIESGYDGRYYYFKGQSGGHSQKQSNSFRICDWVDGKDVIELYVIGEPLDSLPKWTFYRDGGVENGEEISGSVSFIGQESITMLDLALSNYDEAKGISKIDWYNALYSEIKDQDIKYGDYPILSFYGHETQYNRGLMRWYQYEITLGPGERLVNKVTAPMYSSIDRSYTPPVYEYTYLLSPASTWKEFGELDITINTPYYLTESSLDGFEKTEGGYALSLDGLPDSELIFTLSTEDAPNRDNNDSKGPLILLILFVLLPIALVVEAVKQIVKAVKNLLEKIF